MAIDILGSIEQSPPPIDYVLPGMIAGTVGAIVAPGGAGKSMATIELGILVAAGLDLMGFMGVQPVPTGRVVILAAEDPVIALQHRLHALGHHIPVHIRELVQESLAIEPLIGQSLNLFDPTDAARVEDHAYGARLVVLDTLRRFHAGDENNGAQMTQLLGVLESIAIRTGCSILFVHHASKAAALAGQGDLQQASRGSSVLVDDIRWQMYLAGMSKEEAKSLGVDEKCRRYYVRLGASKQNYGEPILAQWLRRVDGGVLVPAHVPQMTGVSLVAATERQPTGSQRSRPPRGTGKHGGAVW